MFSSLFYIQQIILEKIEGLMDAVLRDHPKMFKCTHNCVVLILHDSLSSGYPLHGQKYICSFVFYRMDKVS